MCMYAPHHAFCWVVSRLCVDVLDQHSAVSGSKCMETKTSCLFCVGVHHVHRLVCIHARVKCQRTQLHARMHNTQTLKCETGRMRRQVVKKRKNGMRLLTAVLSGAVPCSFLSGSFLLLLLLLLPLAPSSSPLVSRYDLTGAENHQRAHSGGAGLRHGYVVWC